MKRLLAWVRNVAGRIGSWFRRHAWKLGVAVVLLAVVALLLTVILWSYRLRDRDLTKWSNIAQLFQAVVGLLTLAPILWAVVRYRQIAEDQRKAKHYQAWQAISDAQGKSGSGGRKTALEELHKDGESLVGVNLSCGAYLVGLSLPGCDLTTADLEAAKLDLANLEEASLRSANLERAFLLQVNLKGAHLEHANLREAVLVDSNLRHATLDGANLEGAFLGSADLELASLAKVNLKGAHLEHANLREATMGSADLAGAILEGANLQTVAVARANFEGACLARANLDVQWHDHFHPHGRFMGDYYLSRTQVLSCRDWRGAKLPPDLRDLELPEDAPEEAMDQLGRTWKPPPQAEM